MNPLQEHLLLRTEAPGLIALGIQNGWVHPPRLVALTDEQKRERHRDYNRNWRAKNLAKGLTGQGKPRRRRPVGSVPKGAAYMAAVRHGKLPEFKKGK